MRLMYHPESDSLFLDTPEAVMAEGHCVDVSDDERFRSLAVLDDLDLSQIKPLEAPEKAVGVSGAIAASMAKWARKPADLYPTPKDCTYSLLPHIAHHLPADALILEPACADGQMVEPLREFGYRVEGFDLRPEVTGGQGGVDFLDPANFTGPDKWDAVITNPPFAAAEHFIRRALTVAPVVAMLLKAQYWNTKNRKKLFRETKPYMELNLTWRPAFLAQERGNSPLMDCAWTVWVRDHDGPCTMYPIDRLVECPVNTDTMDMGGL